MAKAVNLNEDLCKHLASIATHEKEMNQNMSRFFAYMKASRAIAGHDKRITSGKEAQELKGVGPKVAVIVDKFLSGEAGDGDGDEKAEEGGDGKPVASSSKDGKRSKSKSKSRDAGGRKHNKDDDDEDKDADADGPPTKKPKKSSTALTTTDSMRILDHYEKLYMDKKTALGLQVKEVNTVGDLRQDTSLVTGAQAACLEAIADLVVPIDGKEEVEALATELKKRIKEALGDHIRLTVCGAYRRGDALDSSLTVLLVHKELSSTSEKAKEELADSLQKVLAALKDVLKYRLDEAKDGGGYGGKSSTTATDRFEALIQLNNSNNNNKWSRVRKLSLRIVPKDCSVGALFTLTGSKRFVESIVFEALERRFSLDENGLRRLGATNVPGQLIPLKSEEELFEYLELPYKKPEERKD